VSDTTVPVEQSRYYHELSVAVNPKEIKKS